MILWRNKMDKGKPCTQCGTCCKNEVCEMGIYVYGKHKAPCKGAKFHDNKYWCECIEAAQGQTKLMLIWRLGIGTFCDSE